MRGVLKPLAGPFSKISQSTNQFGGRFQKNPHAWAGVALGVGVVATTLSFVVIFSGWQPNIMQLLYEVDVWLLLSFKPDIS